MRIDIEIERDPDDDEILAVYFRLMTGKVARTVEVCEGECYADEDADGNLLGVEMLAPGHLQLNLNAVGGRYREKRPDIDALLDEAFQRLSA